MGIFSRKGKDDQDVTRGSDPDSATDDSVSADVVTEGGAADDQPSADAGEPEVDDQPTFDRDGGPFDRSEVGADLDGRLDFGAIAIVPEAGMELRLDIDDQGREITGLTAILGESACQLQAFAAPKTSGVWDDIREEIHDNLVGSGGTAQEVDGPLGLELQVRMPATGQDGRVTYNPARFVGVDGPRWFLRAVLSGAAATDEEAGAHMEEFIKRIVVVRGTEPRAPREMLPLKVPETDAEVEDATVSEQEVEGGAPTADDFKPFERGPEITEVR